MLFFSLEANVHLNHHLGRKGEVLLGFADFYQLHLLEQSNIARSVVSNPHVQPNFAG